MVEEDEHQVTVDASKLQECRAICMTLTEQRTEIPLDIQAQANYYLSTGKSSLQPLFCSTLKMLHRSQRRCRSELPSESRLVL